MTPVDDSPRIALVPITAALLLFAASCGGALPSGAEPAAAPQFGAKCSPNTMQSRPLIVEWPSSDRATLEARMRKGLVPVRYKACSIEVLARCEARGRYVYAATTAKFDHLKIRNVNELYANVPLGAASLEGKLAQAGELNVRMTIVGRYENEKSFVRPDELQGDCARATHVITGVTTGAFEFFAGASGELEASASARLVGASAGGRSSSLHESLSRDGDESRCQSATSRDQQPPDGCGAMLRVELSALGENTAPTCPEGSRYNGQECVRTNVLTVSECPAGTRWDGQACLRLAARAESAATPDAAGAPPPPPAGRFAIVGDVVQDGRSGLAWTKKDVRPTTWTKARELCAKQGMRLPSQQELSELVAADASVGALALDKSAHYWSSSQWATGSVRYLAVAVASGEIKNDWDDEKHCVRCVRMQ